VMLADLQAGYRRLYRMSDRSQYGSAARQFEVALRTRGLDGELMLLIFRLGVHGLRCSFSCLQVGHRGVGWRPCRGQYHTIRVGGRGRRAQPPAWKETVCV
jgi:hypothetical protein